MRYYGLHVPTAYDRTRALPLVIVLHGRGGSAVTAHAFGFNDSADHDGFFVVYPEAIAPARMWFTGLEAGAPGADDVAYVGQVLADVTDLVDVDAQRMYAAGYSNGGTLAAHLAGALPVRIAAFAVVDANIAIRDSQGALSTVAVPKQPVSALFVHGRMDHASPYGGGSSPVLGGNDAVGAREGVGWWAQAMGCAAEPKVFAAGEVELLRYTGCRNGVAVQLVSFPGAHDWPATLPLDARDPPRLADYIMNFFYGKGDPGAQ
jgi:polyhydroxybutyrate depolymerase